MIKLKKNIKKCVSRKICLHTFIFFIFSFTSFKTTAQGYNHNWLIGYYPIVNGRLQFDSNSITVIQENRKLTFESAQANISDQNGNLLMATNGCWIMDSSKDTMMNGSGLNPGPFANAWCQNGYGMPFASSSIILPFPGDSSKYIMFHETGNTSVQYQFMASELYYSIINMTLNGGLGAVIQKNVIAFQDKLNQGMTACKHANGRDWWVTIFKDSTDTVYKILLTPQGIASITTQSLNMPPHNFYNGQPVFSPDGKKFAYYYYTGTLYSDTNQIRLFDFDRCSGNFSNGTMISFIDSLGGLGISFSPNSKYLYACTFQKIFQINTDTSNIPASLQLIAINDGYYSPVPPFQTDFWLMYLAANGKIYISSGNGVVDMHYINSPDSGGIACGVQQHALPLPCLYFRGNVNHPNYYLGCDTASSCTCLTTSINEHSQYDFHFSISPNPTSGIIKIIYLLPQNKTGVFEMFDVNGRKVFSYNLPQWSTLQYFSLPKLSDGLYQCVITSGRERVSKKVAVIKE